MRMRTFASHAFASNACARECAYNGRERGANNIGECAHDACEMRPHAMRCECAFASHALALLALALCALASTYKFAANIFQKVARNLPNLLLCEIWGHLWTKRRPQAQAWQLITLTGRPWQNVSNIFDVSLRNRKRPMTYTFIQFTDSEHVEVWRPRQATVHCVFLITFFN